DSENNQKRVLVNKQQESRNADKYDFIAGDAEPENQGDCILMKNLQGTSLDTKAYAAPTCETDSRSEVPDYTQYFDMINVFSHEQQHSKIPKTSQSTYVEPQYESNIIAATLNMHLAGGDLDQHAGTNEEFKT
nr:hypothetical protein [Tanacetum cinerariifolium]